LRSSDLPLEIESYDLDVALFRRGDEIFALGNECAHKGGNLCDGRIEGDIVTCPLHGWEFDLRSGACMTIPGEAVPRFVVTVEAGADGVHIGWEDMAPADARRPGDAELDAALRVPVARNQ